VTVPGASSVMPTYARYPLTLVRGEGTRVWDDAGGAYHDQVDRLDMVSNLFTTEPQAWLAQRMPVAEPGVFFSNSGAEANEAAIKLARKWGLPQGRPTIVALDGSFHGRTTAALAATGQPAKRAAFEPLVDWLRFVAPDDIVALDTAMTPEVAAVFVEPVLGEGGVRPLADAYLQAARALCDQRGALLIVDEVQTGVGRCGAWAAVERAGVTADVVTLAKALGGGVPIGATMARADIAFTAGDRALATVSEVVA
jgi:acetylornithine/N-succinyldiaminopimelate aminotransferase